MHTYIAKFSIVLLALASISSGKRISKIVGGRNAYIENVPYQVSLQLEGSHLCGGSIIGPRHILTAAHCVQKGLASDYTIRAGSTYHAHGGVIKRVFRIMSHKYFSALTAEYDVAVLELYSALIFSQKIQSIPLDDKEVPLGEGITVAGWGLLSEDSKSDSHPQLQFVILTVVSRQKCQRIYTGYKKITKLMFCAGYTSGGKDTCQGDSGGPAVADGKQVGIVSFGKGCGRINIPGVYTNVAPLVPWIKSKMLTTYYPYNRIPEK